jgi:hypothetical protein
LASVVVVVADDDGFLLRATAVAETALPLAGAVAGALAVLPACIVISGSTHTHTHTHTRTHTHTTARKLLLLLPMIARLKMNPRTSLYCVLCTVY